MADPDDNCSTIANPDQGDTDDDWVGDLCDLDVVRRQGTCASDPDFDPRADLNGDGCVHGTDLILIDRGLIQRSIELN